MLKIVLSLIIFTIFIFQVFITYQKGINADNIKVALLSTYIISLIFPININLIHLRLSSIPSEFGEYITLGLWDILVFMMFIAFNKKETIYKSNVLKWLALLTAIAVFSLFNPNNPNSNATLTGLFYVFSLFFACLIIYRTFNATEILSAFWTSMRIIVIIELIFAIAYPLFQIEAAAKLFYGEDGLYLSSRGFSRDNSAIGTFVHPGPLGLIMSFIFVFFSANYFCGNKKKESLVYLILSSFVIFLTYSRTSYLVAITSWVILFIFNNSDKKTKLIRKAFYIITSVIIVLFIIIFNTSIGKDLFLSYNFDDMQIARLIHLYLGWETFMQNPIFGVGLNSHLSYISSNITLINSLGSEGNNPGSFVLTNPIHNTHVIILAELGIIGGLLWLYGFFALIKQNLRSLIKINRLKILNMEVKHYSIALQFSVGIIICYFVYAFTGWATMHYYTFMFALLALILNEKYKSRIEEIQISN